MAAKNPSETAVKAWARLVRAQIKVMGAVEADLKEAGFPPLSWYDVLLELRRAGGGLRPMELEGRLLLAQHNVSRLIDRMAQKKLVKKRAAAEDGRGQIIEIGETGHDLLRRMWPVYRHAIQRHLGAKLNAAETRRLAKLLENLLDGGA